MRYTLAALAVLLSVGDLFADDWPQFLGPNRNNTTTETVAVWKGPLRERWRRPMGEGNSSPVVAGGRVFLHGKVAEKEEEEVVALDAATGKLLWRNTYPRKLFASNTGNGPRTTPAVSLGRVYTYGITGILGCYDARSGKRLWQVDVHQRFKVARLKYGVTSSPLVEANRVLVHVGGPDAAVAAFDADTGEVVWKALGDPLTTSAPTLVPAAGGARRQVVFQTGHRLVALNALNGRLEWQHPLSDSPLDSAPMPVWTGGILFSSSVHFGGRGLLIKAGEKGMPKPAELWLNDKLGSYYASVVPVGGGCFYMVTNTPMPGADLCCVEEKTGKVRWRVPNVGDWHAGMLGTGDGKVLLIDGKGVLRLLAADPAKYRELARAKIGMAAGVYPALAGGGLYLRDRQQVVCFEVGRP
jgi:outer membrane protein assembly factor BamB